MTEGPIKSGYDAPEPPGDGLRGVRVALLATRWNTGIVNALVAGAEQALRDWGLSSAQWQRIDVPGAFELPLACELVARARSADAVVALGAVIRGETPHFDFVAGECARGLQDVALRHALPVGFGVLTVDNEQQALARCTPDRSNKGYEAALAALEMLRLRLHHG